MVKQAKLELRSAIIESIEELRARTSDFDSGDVVATPSGTGVIIAQKGSSFTFPQEGDDKKIEVSDGETVYVVGFGGRSAVYRGADLKNTTLKKGGNTTGSALAAVSNENAGNKPEDWSRRDLLDFWESVGGSFSEAVSDLEDSEDLSKRAARELAANYKDAVLGTEGWRNRF
ncbi:MAG: hypothetical protein SVV03_02450 [Candidatus Nanohaloarchaea archaeon]|nr:hypothetical protein [Candidatus Nanohaloarchaea archaeon]